MSTEGGVFVRIGGQIIPLMLQQPVAVEGRDNASEAFAPVCCDTCGAVSVIGAPVNYQCYDDDHFAYLDVWYESRHVGVCTECGAALAVELSYTWTKYVLKERYEFSLEGVRATSGQLVSTEGVAIPVEANCGRTGG